MFGKLKKKISKMKMYAEKWDTERYGYVQITPSGKLLPTNNIDLGQLCLVKSDFIQMIEFLESSNV